MPLFESKNLENRGETKKSGGSIVTGQPSPINLLCKIKIVHNITSSMYYTNELVIVNMRVRNELAFENVSVFEMHNDLMTMLIAVG